MIKSPLFSICMCNYNMADTLEQSLTSIAAQLDERFEIIVVDDGSNDNSHEVIEKIAIKFPFIRLIKLQRDVNRRLGITRNVSIENAKGTYVLLHLDCDDVYGPYIKDFCEAFLQIEKANNKNFLLSGQHIQMARKDFLLSHGPYRNIFRGEDRDLWARLSIENAYIPFDHTDFVLRLPKSTKEKLKRVFIYTWDHMQNDFRAGSSLSKFYKYEFKRFSNEAKLSRKLIIYRLLIALPAWLSAQFMEPLETITSAKTPEEMILYRETVRGTVKSLIERTGGFVDWTKLSSEGKKIFDV